MTIAEVIDEILEFETPRKRPSTQANHRIFLKELRSEIGLFELEAFTVREYMGWLRGFRAKKKKRKTFDDYTKYLNVIYNYAQTHRKILYSTSFPKVDPVKSDIARVYSQDELDRMWASMHNYRIRVQFVLAYECFMRLREVLNLKKDRVDLTRRAIFLRPEDVKTGSRTNKGRVIPLSNRAYEMLRFWMDQHPNGDYVFPGERGAPYSKDNKFDWKRVKTRAKITGRARWHDIRHTAISKAVYELKVSLPHLSKVCGTSVKTLERVYLHADVEQLREITQALIIDLQDRKIKA